jgi:hypothetical protein
LHRYRVADCNKPCLRDRLTGAGGGSTIFQQCADRPPSRRSARRRPKMERSHDATGPDRPRISVWHRSGHTVAALHGRRVGSGLLGRISEAWPALAPPGDSLADNSISDFCLLVLRKWRASFLMFQPVKMLASSNAEMSKAAELACHALPSSPYLPLRGSALTCMYKRTQ